MLEIRAIKEGFRGNRISIFIDKISVCADENPATAEPLVFKERKLYESVDTATVHLEGNAPQVLIDDLWNCGLRPSEGSGSAGQLAAVERHLSDLKTILFHKLKIQQEDTNGKT